MSNILKMLAHGQAVDAKTYIEDVFSAYTYTGNDGAMTATIGVDVEGKKGLLWIKNRTGALGHFLSENVYDTGLRSNTTDAAFAAAAAYTLTYSSTGFAQNNGYTDSNDLNVPYISWFFAQADKFFKVAQVTKSAGSDATVDLSSLTTIGMIAVKRTDDTGNWFVYHRSCTAGKLLYLNLTDAEATLGHITVSGTTLTLEDGVIADGTYIVYAWAHDTGADGLIQCGSFTTASDGSLSSPLNLGWEPQYFTAKAISTTSGWNINDIIRGLNNTGYAYLSGNTADYEVDGAGTGTGFVPIATGISLKSGYLAASAQSYIYLAIRRGPMKLPTVGTQVYNAIARTGTGAAATVTGVGFPPDLSIIDRREGWVAGAFFDRLRGGAAGYLESDAASAEDTTSKITSYDMDGFTLPISAITNATDAAYINWFFRRYPGVFDVVCYTGTGAARTVDHNLGAVPELMIVKNRSGSADHWHGYHAAVGNTKSIRLNLDMVPSTSSSYWNNTSPTQSVFTVGTNESGNGTTYVTYLFATLAGISKVFSITKVADANLDVDCGFAAGARIVLLKRTDDVGPWYVWDSVCGIIAGNDPYLLLNTTDAEVTNTDYIDPLNAGFTIVDNGLADGDYIGVAIS